MYKYIKTDTRELTPKECEEFLQYNTFPGQRPRDLRKARLYSEAMLDGSMLPCDVALAIMPDGSMILMNGQHVLTGGCLAAKNHLFRIAYYECEQADDAWKLFAKFDTHQSRSKNVIMKGARGLFRDERLRDVPLAVLSHCGTALNALSASNGIPVFTSARLIDKTLHPRLVEEHPDDVLYVARFAEKKHLMRCGVVTAIIAISRQKHPKADEFWRQIADGVGFQSKLDPAYRLREQLLEGVVQADTSNSGRHRIYYTLCVTWWNAWLTGEKRSSVKLAAMDRPPKVALAA